MTKYLLLLLIVFHPKKFDSQFITDNFTAIGGANQWFKAFGGPTMGVDGGTYLCYNVASSYSSSTNYSFESPNYSSDIATANCNTITVTFRAAGSIRNSDSFVFCTYNGSWACYTVVLNSSFTIYSVTLPKSNYKFSFDLYSGSTGNLSGKYVHVDWFKIVCASILDIEILDFKVEVGNYVSWTLVSDALSSGLILERSIDGYNWLTVYNSNYTYSSSFNDQGYVRDSINYYRLKISTDGEIRYSDIIAANNKEKFRLVIGLFNILGEVVDVNYKGVVIEVYSDGFIRKTIKE